ncbi:MAG: putative selenate reductase subunit YgfK [Eubacteriales bacterium]|nr:putative selenate reductase subunit YgfK [Eubacteriales bacterium]MDD4541111.1 putative selenate reductase subunit YgfK [Eubacteriales bacterium]
MGDIMRPMGFEQLINWSLSEYKQENSVFGVNKKKFYINRSGRRMTTVLGDKLASAVGPAAGPATQLAQNIVASYLGGARFLELKTVQVMDGEEIRNAVPKPCILAQDEAYNCEWSTELTVGEAYEEYVKGWLAIHVLAPEFGVSDADDFAFNMSVGYDLAGIKTEKIDNFIEGLKDASNSPVFKEGINFLKENVDKFENVTLEDIEAISPNICNAATLSTLHGCPPDEIEAISKHLLTEKHVSVFVKCNPTMLGYDYAREALDKLGYDYVAFPDTHFKGDLQYDDAVEMFARLLPLAEEKGLAFGAKLTNTFPCDTDNNQLPADSMYMSGRSLMALTVSLATKLSEAFDGKLPISYSGGADAFNINELLKTGIGPVTMATTLLKPGGYARFNQIAQKTEYMLKDNSSGQVDVEALRELRDKSYQALPNQKRYREKVASRKTDSVLELYDCYKAPCKDGGCPINQQIPEYLKLVADGKYDKAMRVIAIDNACPTITGVLCAQPCREKCTRLDYDTAINMRDVKLKAADESQNPYVSNITASELRTDKKAVVIGAGPGGIAAAIYLRRNGLEVDVFEQRDKSHGIVRYAIPDFRISEEQIDRDYELAVAEGVNFHFNCDPKFDLAKLREEYDYVVVAIGAWSDGRSPVSEGQDKVHDALEVLIKAKESESLNMGKRVAVIGAGDVAMDSARLAKRTAGVEHVDIVYRRTEAYMPASQDEYDDAVAEGVGVLELLAPVSYDGKTLRCEKMLLGDYDASGRKSVNGTAEFVDLEYDFVIGATGARVNPSLFEKFGLALDERKRPKLSEVFESSESNVYVVGDCRRGPSTVVAAMGDSRTVAKEILRREGLSNDFDRVEVPMEQDEINKRRGVLMHERERSEEGLRCLKCDQFCEICKEVCPNRANVAIAVPGFENLHQILHMDGMCNECGNCGTFCPHAGLPYKDKFTLFWTREDFEDSENVGFLKLDDDRYLVRDSNTQVFESGIRDERDERMLDGFVAMITAVEKDYPWLLTYSA